MTCPSVCLTRMGSGSGGVGKKRCRPGETLHLPRAHERRLSSNHSKPPAATVNTTMMLHGVDEIGSSLVGEGTLGASSCVLGEVLTDCGLVAGVSCAFTETLNFVV